MSEPPALKRVAGREGTKRSPPTRESTKSTPPIESSSRRPSRDRTVRSLMTTTSKQLSDTPRKDGTKFGKSSIRKSSRSSSSSASITSPTTLTSPKRLSSGSGTPVVSVSSSVVSTDGDSSTVPVKRLHPRRQGLQWEPGAKIDAMDYLKNWYPGKIVEVDESDATVLVHFEGWNSRFDEWLDMRSERLRSPIISSSAVEGASGGVAASGPPHGGAQRAGKDKANVHVCAGDVVLAKWTNVGRYPAEVLYVSRNDEGDVPSCCVRFYDGVERTVKVSAVQVVPAKDREQVVKQYKEAIAKARGERDKDNSEVEAGESTGRGRKRRTTISERPVGVVGSPSGTPAQPQAGRSSRRTSVRDVKDTGSQPDNVVSKSKTVETSSDSSALTQKLHAGDISGDTFSATSPSIPVSLAPEDSIIMQAAAVSVDNQPSLEPSVDNQPSLEPSSISNTEDANKSTAIQEKSINVTSSIEITNPVKPSEQAAAHSLGEVVNDATLPKPQLLTGAVHSNAPLSLAEVGICSSGSAPSLQPHLQGSELKQPLSAAQVPVSVRQHRVRAGDAMMSTSSGVSLKTRLGGVVPQPGNKLAKTSLQRRIDGEVNLPKRIIKRKVLDFDPDSAPGRKSRKRTSKEEDAVKTPVSTGRSRTKASPEEKTTVFTTGSKTKADKAKADKTSSAKNSPSESDITSGKAAGRVAKSRRSDSKGSACVPATEDVSSKRGKSLPTSPLGLSPYPGYITSAAPVVAAKAFKVEENHNPYKCPHSGCDKTFRKQSLLSSHEKHYHRASARAAVSPSFPAPASFPSPVLSTPVSTLAPPGRSARDRKKTVSMCSTDSEISVGGGLPSPVGSPTAGLLSQLPPVPAFPPLIKPVSENSTSENTSPTVAAGDISAAKREEGPVNNDLLHTMTPCEVRIKVEPGLDQEGIIVAANSAAMPMSTPSTPGASIKAEPMDEDGMDITDGDREIDDGSVVNCVCGNSEEMDLMVQCELCQCWQHAACFDIPEEVASKSESYVCFVCGGGTASAASNAGVNLDWFTQGCLPRFDFSLSSPAVSDMASSAQVVRVKSEAMEGEGHTEITIEQEVGPLVSAEEKRSQQIVLASHFLIADLLNVEKCLRGIRCRLAAQEKIEAGHRFHKKGPVPDQLKPVVFPLSTAASLSAAPKTPHSRGISPGLSIPHRNSGAFSVPVVQSTAISKPVSVAQGKRRLSDGQLSVPASSLLGLQGAQVSISQTASSTTSVLNAPATTVLADRTCSAGSAVPGAGSASRAPLPGSTLGTTLVSIAAGSIPAPSVARLPKKSLEQELYEAESEIEARLDELESQIERLERDVPAAHIQSLQTYSLQKLLKDVDTVTLIAEIAPSS